MGKGLASQNGDTDTRLGPAAAALATVFQAAVETSEEDGGDDEERIIGPLGGPGVGVAIAELVAGFALFFGLISMLIATVVCLVTPESEVDACGCAEGMGWTVATGRGCCQDDQDTAIADQLLCRDCLGNVECDVGGGPDHVPQPFCSSEAATNWVLVFGCLPLFLCCVCCCVRHVPPGPRQLANCGRVCQRLKQGRRAYPAANPHELPVLYQNGLDGAVEATLSLREFARMAVDEELPGGFDTLVSAYLNSAACSMHALVLRQCCVEIEPL